MIFLKIILFLNAAGVVYAVTHGVLPYIEQRLAMRHWRRTHPDTASSLMPDFSEIEARTLSR